MSNKRIRVSELEFDAIKDNLKNFLRGQSTFSDYDFEGSNLSVLIDLLAYNTHYNALYTNFAINEAYIDSASKRDSVVSIARSLGYTPRSAQCATTKINLTVTGTSSTPSTVTLPKNTPFYGVKDGVRYYFYNTSDVTTTYSSGAYTWNNLILKEGVPVSNTLSYSESNQYVIPNAAIDTTTLEVDVTIPLEGTFSFKNANSISNITGNSDVYFLHEIDGGFYRLTFGDDVLGRALIPGSIITLKYMVCNGATPNRISTVSYGGGNILGSNAIAVTMVTKVLNGKDRETIDEIKFNAPNLYAAQDRAVTVEDYKAILKSKVAVVGDCIVWGGENHTPPTYGKVFVSAITPSGNALTSDEKYSLLQTMDKYKIAVMQVEYIDAEFIDVALQLAVYYDQTQTSNTADQIRAQVYDAFDIFNTENMGKFDSIIRNSSIIHTAEKSNSAIINVIPSLMMFYTLNVFYNSKSTYTIKIKNPINSTIGSFYSSMFYCNESEYVCAIDNGRDKIAEVDDKGNPMTIVDETGKTVSYIQNPVASELWLYEILPNGTRRDIRKVGGISFTDGMFTLNNLTITSLAGTDTSLKIGIKPASRDVVGFNNKVVRLDMSKLEVQAIADTNINGQNKNSYTFVQI